MQPLAGGFCATLWGIMGDLDYFTKALLLPRSTQEKGPCSLRRCRGKGAFTWSDFRRQAPWRQVQWTAQAWRNWPDRSPSILFTLENFSPWLIAMDLMHVKYLGHETASKLLANCPSFFDKLPHFFGKVPFIFWQFGLS